MHDLYALIQAGTLNLGFAHMNSIMSNWLR